MMRVFQRRLTCFAAVVTLCAPWVAPRTCESADLLDVYKDALSSDAQISKAADTRRAALQGMPQALAALLPQITATAEGTRSGTNEFTDFLQSGSGNQVVATSYGTNSWTTSWGYTVQIAQSLFSWSNWKSIERAHRQAAQAEVDYRMAVENLILRTIQAYCGILNAEENLDAQTATRDAYVLELANAEKRYAAQLIAKTDVYEAEAQRDSSVAAVIEAKRSLASMEQALKEITGRTYATLSKPSDAMSLNGPEPADPERWVSAAMDQNLALIDSRLAADIARSEVEITRASHFPTLDLVGSQLHFDSQGEQEITAGGPAYRLNTPSNQSDRQVTLRLTVPIFAGGLVSSKTKQAEYEWRAAKAQVTEESRETEHQVHDAYDAVLSEVARATALKQNLRSAAIALRAAEAGYAIGTRAETEVIQQRQTLLQAQTNYADARYTYILAVAQLHLATGTLDPSVLAAIDRWLDAPARNDSQHSVSALPGQRQLQ